ncbi:MAG: dienelactone hydrolase family protein [Proteobacteria bacterium]|nr:dienelactone hydrolase family protein [Pseudomonadota bacterium]
MNARPTRRRPWLGRCALTLAAMVLAPAATHAQLHAWPFAPYGPVDWYSPPTGGEAVRIRSSQAGGGELMIPGVLYKPTGSAKGAVVIVDSTMGWRDTREGHYGRSLSSAGYVVLAIDTFGPRSINDMQTDLGLLDPYAQLRDAFAARQYLVGLGQPADRLAIMGTGRGGTIALLAADRTFLPGETQRFSLAMAVTPGCFLRPRDPKPVAKVFMALAQKDDIAGVAPCQALATDYIAAGGAATYKTYANASNSFDGNPVVVRMVREPFIESFGRCEVAVEPDGLAVYDARHFAPNEFGALVAQMRKSCIQRGGTVWTNLTRKANLTLDLIEFLDASFRR